MKVKLKKFRVKGQTILTHIDESGAVFSWTEEGQQLEVEGAIGYKLIGLYPDMLEEALHEVEIVKRGRPPKYDNKAEV